MPPHLFGTHSKLYPQALSLLYVAAHAKFISQASTFYTPCWPHQPVHLRFEIPNASDNVF